MYKNSILDFIKIFSDKRWLIVAVITSLIGITALVVINVTKVFIPKTPEIQITKNYGGYEIGEIGNILGNKDATFVIHEYTDYECPYCAISNNMLLRLTKDVKGIRIEHHDFPLNSNCNPLMKNAVHKNSCSAIYYAKAARMQGKFWDLSTLLFENQKNLDEKNILKLAASIGLDIEKLKKDSKNPKFKFEIEKDVRKAKRYGILGTPSYVIGIKRYEGLMPYHELKSKIPENL